MGDLGEGVRRWEEQSFHEGEGSQRDRYLSAALSTGAAVRRGANGADRRVLAFVAKTTNKRYLYGILYYES